MKKLLLITFMVLSLGASATRYYLAPSGNDNNSGTISSPFFTLKKAWSLVAAGDTIYLRGGNYSYPIQQDLTNKSGTAANNIKVWAYPNESPVISRAPSSTATFGLYIRGNYIHIKGIEVYGFSQLSAENYANIQCYDINYCTFENIKSHHSMYGFSVGIYLSTSVNNLFLNCDSYWNDDPISNTPHEHSDGFSIHVTGIGTNTFVGCRAWWNGDDGYDFLNSECNYVLENCWSFFNGYVPGTFSSAGNGQGFKLGHMYNFGNYSTEIKRTLKNCQAFMNKSYGFDQNNAKCRIALYNNTSYKNAYGYWMQYYYQTDTIQHIVKNNIAFANTSGPGYFNPASIIDHNTFNYWNTNNVNYNVTNADFLSLDTTGVTGSRQTDFSLPDLNFLKLAAGSDLIDTGTDVGLSYHGENPDLGPFEYVPTVVVPTNKFVKSRGKLIKSATGEYLK